MLIIVLKIADLITIINLLLVQFLRWLYNFFRRADMTIRHTNAVV